MDNTDLLSKIIEQCTTAEVAADLLNNAKTVMGNFAYHEAALRGNCKLHKLFYISLEHDTSRKLPAEEC